MNKDELFFNVHIDYIVVAAGIVVRKGCIGCIVVGTPVAAAQNTVGILAAVGIVVGTVAVAAVAAVDNSVADSPLGFDSAFAGETSFAAVTAAGTIAVVDTTAVVDSWRAVVAGLLVEIAADIVNIDLHQAGAQVGQQVGQQAVLVVGAVGSLGVVLVEGVEERLEEPL